MTKRKKSLVVRRQIVKQLRLPEMRYRFEQFFMGQSCDGFQNCQQNQSAYHGRRFENLFCNFFEVVDACRNDGLHGRRQWNCINSAFQPICTSLALEITAFGDRVDEFLEKERIAAKPAKDPRRNALAAAIVPVPMRVEA